MHGRKIAFSTARGRARALSSCFFCVVQSIHHHRHHFERKSSKRAVLRKRNQSLSSSARSRACVITKIQSREGARAGKRNVNNIPFDYFFSRNFLFVTSLAGAFSWTTMGGGAAAGTTKGKTENGKRKGRCICLVLIILPRRHRRDHHHHQLFMRARHGKARNPTPHTRDADRQATVFRTNARTVLAHARSVAQRCRSGGLSVCPGRYMYESG